ncbi:MAG: F0F1 ATP synthase subunit delta [Paracoccaceae bacterium]
MADNASLTSGIAGRYAQALFELANEAGKAKEVESDLDSLAQAIADSPDLRGAIYSPVYSRADKVAAMSAVCRKMGLGAEVANTVGLMALKRRLFVLPQMIKAVKALLAADRGEVSAEVTAARKLSSAQSKALAAALKKSFGKDVSMNVAVDEDLIGGLVVKVGSKMIDTSIRSKLSKLQNAMKEVG